jgi:putative endonuclease
MTSLGKDGEELAVKYLKSKGYKILDKNYRCSLGEIDVVVKEKDMIVFVEVKTRKSDEFAEPFESVGVRKQAKLRSLAEFYLQEKDYLDREIRFDVLSITVNDKETNIEHIKDAFN